MLWPGSRVLPHVLDFLVLGEPGRTELAPDPRVFEPAPLGLWNVWMVVVDPHGPVPEAPGDPLGLAGVLRPHRAGQAVDRVVGDAHRLVLGPERLDGEDRPERLLVHHPHAGVAAVEDGRAVEVPGVALAPAAAGEPGTLGEAGLHVRLDLGQVTGRDQRAGLRVGVERPAEPDRFGPLG